MTNDVETLTVELEQRSYPIHIGEGLTDNARFYLDEHIGGGRIAIITDTNVGAHHLKRLCSGITPVQNGGNPGGDNVEIITLPPGEASKSFNVLQQVLDTLLRADFSRDDTLIAFGGGVIGDLTGFVASVLKRGCQFIQIPTTLLAQVDSSVGGKTAINTGVGKNLVGTFYQPKCVLIDTSVLSTLDARQMRAGYAEVLKYALINDTGFFNWLEIHADGLLSGTPDIVRTAILKSCTAKAGIVARDEREHGERALLNLGHSFAHALEAQAGFDGSLLHGEAVSAGMLMAFELSQNLGLCSGQDVARLRAHLRNTKMPIFQDLPKHLKDHKALFAFMGRDKKNKAGAMNLILARSIGGAFVQQETDQSSVQTYLKKASELEVVNS